MGRIGATVYLQERIVFSEELLEPLDPMEPWVAVGERTTVSEESLPLSEWEVTLEQPAPFILVT